MTAKKVLLIILDGWGLGAPDESNPIHVVNPANFRWLAENYPLTSLQASGIAVGLPWGEVGNSDVGHLTIGAGKVVYQYYPKITMAIEDGSFYENPVLQAACAHAKTNGSALHLAGLLTKTNVDAAISHLQSIMKLAEQAGVPAIKLHLFSDGKDSPPRTVGELLKRVPRERVVTLSGRHYAMNRSDNWTLTQKTYDIMTSANAPVAADLDATLKALYAKSLSEEFLPPTRLSEASAIADGDALLFFNFREDSILQLAEAFALPDFDKFAVQPYQNLYVATLTQYSSKLPCPSAFTPDTVEEPLGQVLAEAGKAQMRIAETYKHAHVTYFFNGHREAPFQGEYRVLIPSLVNPHPDEHPELMAAAITDRVLETIQNRAFDFILVNYSNPDTIAHTGNYDACLQAVRVVDEQLGRILKVVPESDYAVVITSDHGNMEEVISPVTGQIETQHDANPVPLYLVAPELKGRRFFNYNNLRNETTGILADVAPTILELMGLSKPAEMTGHSLLRDLM
ncbi:MAG TPA: 2,3-bisphosphoglycerate-independent phosphoglycerate mutase [Candidatus Paceibacterota bacterium]|nr:2,3-bisphosphoglycerate-independent phosphoglycerate mutase [Candidatus Paceibacterota bacterium]